MTVFKLSKDKLLYLMVSIRWYILAIWVVSAVAYCAPPGTFRKIDFEFTGTVRDGNTKEPIEGAYVVVLYYGSAASPATVATFCTKTKGMYTGKDGTFRFPVEKLNNLSPGDVMAIKPGYFDNNRVIPSASLQRAQTAETYTGRDVILTKQNPASPTLRFGETEVRCERANSRDDVEASIQFLKIKLAECLRLNASTQGIDAIKNFLADLENLSAGNPKKL